MPNTHELLRAEGLVKRYGGRTVLDCVSVAVSEGQIIVVVGGNGAGKTTLLDILSGHTEPDSGELSIRAGEAWLDFHFPSSPFDFLRRWRRPSRLAAAGLRRVWQDCRLFPSLSLSENLLVAYPRRPGESILDLVRHPIFTYRAERAARREGTALLDRVGLGGRGYSPGNSLSLGQEKRLAIARALETGGRLILLDEPLAGLDSQGRQLVLDLVKEFMAMPGKSVIIAEHIAGSESLMSLAAQVWELKASRLTVALGVSAPAAQAESGRNVLTNYLGAAAFDGLECDEIRLPGGACLLKLRTCGERASSSALSIRDLVVQREGKTVLGWKTADGNVQGLSFDLALGEVGALVAPNGWGKTTLLEAIVGLLPVRAGTVALGGFSLDGTPTWARARRGLRLLRAREVLFASLTVAETMRLLRYPIAPSLNSLSQTRVGLLSGGERRRLGLSTLGESRVLLVDEPFSGLDTSGIQTAWSALRPEPGSARLLAIPERMKGTDS